MVLEAPASVPTDVIKKWLAIISFVSVFVPELSRISDLDLCLAHRTLLLLSVQRSEVYCEILTAKSCRPNRPDGFSMASHSVLQYLPDVITHEQTGCAHL
jgi:hypothetical protein